MKKDRKKRLAGVLICSMLMQLCLVQTAAAEEAAAAAEGQTDAASETAADSETAAAIGELAAATFSGAVSEDQLRYAKADETLYVNLDYFGAVDKVNVVKGISSSKALRYTDFGNYTDVINMSTEEAPGLDTPGQVSFDLDGSQKKFFFEGKMDPSETVLPWNISVSYTLNGVETDPSELAGATGTIGIHFDAEPNEAANAYLKNNMILAALVPVDADKIYSVDAPGSQTQSIGDITGVLYTALPGEARTFDVRLGAEDYESIGLVIMMMPGTVDSLENIVDIKELKDTWKDSGDAMYDSMDTILSIVESLQSDMDGVSSSLQKTDQARQQLADNKAGIFAANEEALNDLNQVSSELQTLVPYISSTQNGLWQLNSNVNELIGTVSDMQHGLSYLERGLNRLADGSFFSEDDLGDLSSQLADVIASNDRLQTQLDELDQAITLLDGILSSDDLKAALTAENIDALKTLAGKYGVSESDQKKLEAGIQAILQGQASQEVAAAVQQSLETMLTKLKKSKSQIEGLISDTDSMADSLQRMLSGAGRAATGAGLVTSDLQDAIADVESVNDTLNRLYPDLQNILTETQSILQETGKSLNAGSNALLLAQDVLKSVSDLADSALEEGIQTSLDMVEKNKQILDATASLRSAGQTAKDALDGEVDKFESENNFLNIDPSAKKQSFTSEENITPDSVQIILRTEEISKDDDEKEVMDAESKKSDEGLWQRIVNVFSQIIASIVSIFKNA